MSEPNVIRTCGKCGDHFFVSWARDNFLAINESPLQFICNGCEVIFFRNIEDWLRQKEGIVDLEVQYKKLIEGAREEEKREK